MISYETMYLKTHHPSKFMAALLNASLGDKAKMLQALRGINNSGLELKPPDLFKSGLEFKAINNKTIMFGLGGIKHLKNAATIAKKARRYNPKNLTELVLVANTSKLNIMRMKSLVHAGALDEMGSSDQLNRAGMLKALELLYEYKKKRQLKEEQLEKWNERKKIRSEQEEKKARGEDYGGRLVSVGKEPEIPEPPDISIFQSEYQHPYDETMAEHEALGFCINEYPTEHVDLPEGTKQTHRDTFKVEDILDLIPGQRCSLVALISDKKEINTRGNKLIGNIIIEDETGLLEVRINAKYYSEIKQDVDKHIVAQMEVRKEKWKAEGDMFTLVPGSFKRLHKGQIVLKVDTYEQALGACLSGVPKVVFGNIIMEKKE